MTKRLTLTDSLRLGADDFCVCVCKQVRRLKELKGRKHVAASRPSTWPSSLVTPTQHMCFQQRGSAHTPPTTPNLESEIDIQRLNYEGDSVCLCL